MDQGIILHHYPYQNDSLILKTFTEHQGVVTLVARGARKLGKRSADPLQSFCLYQLEYMPKPTSMQTLKQFESLHYFSLTRIALYCGYYCNECLLKLLPEYEPHPDLFSVYSQTLDQLSEHKADLNSALRNFEYQLLSNLGYLPDLEMDQNGQAVDLAKHYSLQPEHAPCLVNEDEVSAVPGRVLQGIAHQQWNDPDTCRWAKKIFQAHLLYFSGGRTFKTKAFLSGLAHRFL